MVLLCCFKDLLVAKIYSKMACVLAKMDQADFPTLDDIIKALDHQVSETAPCGPLLGWCIPILHPDLLGQWYTHRENLVHACA